MRRAGSTHRAVPLSRRATGTSDLTLPVRAERRPGWVPLRPDFPPLEPAPALRRRPRGAASSPVPDAGGLPRRVLEHLGRGDLDLAGRARTAMRRLLRHRRLLAAACAALAMTCGIEAVQPPAPSVAAVVVAAHDLAAGAIVTPRDLRVTELPVGVVPAGVLRSTADAAGRRLSGAVRRGEPLTDVRLDDGPLSVPGRGLVATPVRFADADAARLLQPGDHVDVLAARAPEAGLPEEASPAAADLVAADVAVVALPTAPSDSTSSVADGSSGGALVVLATTPTQARLLAQAAVTSKLSAIVVN